MRLLHLDFQALGLDVFLSTADQMIDTPARLAPVIGKTANLFGEIGKRPEAVDFIRGHWLFSLTQYKPRQPMTPPKLMSAAKLRGLRGKNDENPPLFMLCHVVQPM
jgi:hypothetical protein